MNAVGGGQADEETRLKNFNLLLTLRCRPSARRIQNTPLLLLILFRIHIFHKFPNPFLVRIALIANFAELPAQQVLHHQFFWCILLLSVLKPTYHSKACPRQNGLF